MTDHLPAATDDLAITMQRIGALAAEVETLASEPGASTAVVPAKRDDPVALRASMIDKRAELVSKRLELEALRGQAKALIRAQQEALEAALNAQMEILRPMQLQVEKMTDGIAAMNLYLGRDEDIHTLRSGEPAPASTPITVRQLVLSMDQECAASAESGGMDARSIEEFTTWLLADAANLDQVLPEAKGVVGRPIPVITAR